MIATGTSATSPVAANAGAASSAVDPATNERRESLGMVSKWFREGRDIARSRAAPQIS
jgi:hypothetical protein